VTRWLRLAEDHPGATIASIGLLFALAYGASLIWLAKPGGRLVFGDALHHYVQLRSAVFDHDLRFTNEYVRMYGITASDADDPDLRWITDTNAGGYIRNLMPVGPAIVWAPGFLVMTGAIWMADALGASYPFDGYGRLFQAAAAYSGIAAAVAGVWLAFLTARFLFRPRAAIWATLAIWLAGSAVYYTVISPTYSHAPSMLAVGAFWYVWIRTRNRQDVARYAWVGVFAGVAALMRWQDAVLLIVPAIDAAWHRERGLLSSLTNVVVATACAVAAFAPQLYVWHTLYGHFLVIPQGGGFMRWGAPALWSILFSDNHGLLTWTPVIALAIAGLVPLTRRAPLVGIAAVAFLSISWYVNAAVADWWAGEAFGARRFVGCYPVFVLATAALFERLDERPVLVAGITTAFTACTFLLLVQYQTFMHGLRSVAPYPRGLWGLWLARFVVPFEIAKRWLHQ
jgi:hypothetical protein